MSTHTSSIVLDGDTCEFRTTLRANGDQQHVVVQINAVRGNVFAQNLTHLHLDLDAAVRLYQELGFALAWASYRDNIRTDDLALA